MTSMHTEAIGIRKAASPRHKGIGAYICFAAAALLMCSLVSVVATAAPLQAALNTTTTASDPVTTETRYRIQYSDVIELSFPLSPEFNQTVTVKPDGYIETVNGRDVHASGMTIPELVQAVRESYATTLHNPIVTVNLKDYQRPYFTVIGQVGHPGRFDLRGDVTVTEAIALAGGLTQQAKWRVFLVRPISEGLAEVQRVNMNDTQKGKHLDTNAHLRTGDIIYVPEMLITKFRKYIPYYVGANLATLF